MTAQDWQVGRLVECCLKQKGDYYPHLAQFDSFNKAELSPVFEESAEDAFLEK
jgi:hypothetical protein